MNKEQLITRNSGVKLYDLSDPIDMHRMNMNLHYCSKKGREPTFKLIAPFGHPLKHEVDFYYFESENTPITEQILEEMGFVHQCFWIGNFFIEIDEDFDVILNHCSRSKLYCNNIKTANQLHTLIELLK